MVIVGDVVSPFFGVARMTLLSSLLDDASCRSDMLMEIDGVSGFPESSGVLVPVFIVAECRSLGVPKVLTSVGLSL